MYKVSYDNQLIKEAGGNFGSEESTNLLDYDFSTHSTSLFKSSSSTSETLTGGHKLLSAPLTSFAPSPVSSSPPLASPSSNPSDPSKPSKPSLVGKDIKDHSIWTTCNMSDRPFDNSSLSCTDQNIKCPYWASEGECNADPDYVLIYYKLSCGMCRSLSCNEQYIDCSYWASEGCCKTRSVYSDYMLISCKVSCVTCPLPSPSTSFLPSISFNPVSAPSLSAVTSHLPSANPASVPSLSTAPSTLLSFNPTSSPSSASSNAPLLSAAPSLTLCTTSVPWAGVLTLFGNSPNCLLPECAGHCIADSDCASDLFCFKRDDDYSSDDNANGINDSVPGCETIPYGRVNYCVAPRELQPSAAPSSIPTKKPSLSPTITMIPSSSTQTTMLRLFDPSLLQTPTVTNHMWRMDAAWKSDRQTQIILILQCRLMVWWLRFGNIIPSSSTSITTILGPGS